MFAFLFISLAIVLVKSSGFASYGKDSDSAGKCSIPAGSFEKWAAVGPAAFEGSRVCGACINVTGTASGKSTIAHVVDQCLKCDKEDINLSKTAFTDIEDTVLGRRPVSWSVIKCPDVTGNIQYAWYTGSNQWWSGVQIRNHAETIASVSYSKSKTGPWTPFIRRDDNYFTGKGIASPVFFNVTSTSGKSIIDADMSPMAKGEVVEGSSQF